MLTVLQQLTNLVYSTDLTQSVRICIELISIITGSICFTNVSSMTTSKDVFFMTASIFLSTICFNLLFYFSCNNILVCYDLQQLWQSSANSCGISDKWLWQKYGSKYSSISSIHIYHYILLIYISLSMHRDLPCFKSLRFGKHYQLFLFFNEQHIQRKLEITVDWIKYQHNPTAINILTMGRRIPRRNILFPFF